MNNYCLFLLPWNVKIINVTARTLEDAETIVINHFTGLTKISAGHLRFEEFEYELLLSDGPMSGTMHGTIGG